MQLMRREWMTSNQFARCTWMLWRTSPYISYLYSSQIQIKRSSTQKKATLSLIYSINSGSTTSKSSSILPAKSKTWVPKSKRISRRFSLSWPPNQTFWRSTLTRRPKKGRCGRSHRKLWSLSILISRWSEWIDNLL